ncbi:uncharacterized protein TNIN_99141 [Trichonephila inaurata madagascariensis]|uniref:Uncharacterized protein n=1 Tax=Trichonephila inaurata madagascariensis TaxID=2747483 RepID=A0A8X6X2W6_9ARAC|nr:uncharacterized protein TNIN_99141 [Trichonephila inaurata madagascariensis]
MKISVENAKSLNMKTCIVTFDQPLYIKSQDITSAICLSDEMFPVVRLDSFHALMSYMGSIGYIMAGSGIKEALSTVYAKNIINHIMSGRAYARAAHAHILLQLALSRLIFDYLLKNNSEFKTLIADETNANIFFLIIPK